MCRKEGPVGGVEGKIGLSLAPQVHHSNLWVFLKQYWARDQVIRLILPHFALRCCQSEMAGHQGKDKVVSSTRQRDPGCLRRGQQTVICSFCVPKMPSLNWMGKEKMGQEIKRGASIWLKGIKDLCKGKNVAGELMKRVVLEKDFNLSFEATGGNDIKAECQIRAVPYREVLGLWMKKKIWGEGFFFNFAIVNLGSCYHVLWEWSLSSDNKVKVRKLGWKSGIFLLNWISESALRTTEKWFLFWCVNTV